MASQTPPQILTIPIPPGPLGVGIQKKGGYCIVSSINETTLRMNGISSPLIINDIILSLNGIKLKEVQHAPQSWMKLFKAFQIGQRTLVVQRPAIIHRPPHATITMTQSRPVNQHPAMAVVPTNNSMPSPDKLLESLLSEKSNATTSLPPTSARYSSALNNSTKHNAVVTTVKKQKLNGNNSALATKTSSSMEVISLLDDSDDEDGGGDGKRRSTAVSSDIMEVSHSSASSGWRRESSSTMSSSSSEPTGNLKDDRDYGGAHKSDEEEEDEIAVVATKGQNALADFPHSRANCVTHLFAASSDKKVHCANCYCYVCDIPANECKEWATHCEASHDNPHWRGERERVKRRARELASAPTSQASSALSAVARPATVSTASASYLASLVSSSTSSARRSAEFSVRALLEKVTTVHPVEMSPPVRSGFTTALRHYQKQSLAFMVDIERTKNRGGWLCDEVGLGKSAVVLALVATNPASPKTISTTQQVNETASRMAANDQRRAQIQVAYYQECGRIDQAMEQALLHATDEDNRNKLTGHYMGLKRMERERKDAKLLSEMLPVSKLKLKTTVVLTSVSLLGQWEDEVKKHAPGLVVKVYHGSRKKALNNMKVLKDRDIPDLAKVDVLISTATFAWPTSSE